MYMKIQKHDARELKSQRLVELRDLLAQPSDRKVRPCPDCRIRFGQESILSAAHCSFKCRYAPRHMSGSPDRYPIEPGIVPLVYALYSMRLITPCWSCEGHVESDGVMRKRPKVWFYSSSSFYVKLISQTINDLQSQHKISSGWGIRILPFSESMYSTTYSIEPLEINVGLEKLRADIILLGKELRFDLLLLAKDYLKRGVQNAS